MRRALLRIVLPQEPAVDRHMSVSPSGGGMLYLGRQIQLQMVFPI